MTTSGGNELAAFDWATVVPLLIHPVKVGIIEALWRIEEPLSSTDLKEILSGQVALSAVSYHVGYLARAGVVVKVSERQARGCLQKFYLLA